MEGYSNHPVCVCVCVCVATCSQRLQDFAIQTSFQWTEQYLEGQEKDFVIKTLLRKRPFLVMPFFPFAFLRSNTELKGLAVKCEQVMSS